MLRVPIALPMLMLLMLPPNARVELVQIRCKVLMRMQTAELAAPGNPPLIFALLFKLSIIHYQLPIIRYWYLVRSSRPKKETPRDVETSKRDAHPS